jgi:putative FmdB family regulatory protein
MLYDYECKCGNEFEKIVPVSEYSEPQVCPKCGREAEKVMKLGHGGILRTGDSVPWIRSLNNILTDGDKPNSLETIQDLRNYYATHPNVVPAESHPAIPSSLGDAIGSKQDPMADKQKRSKQGHELIRKMRRIEVSRRA